MFLNLKRIFAPFAFVFVLFYYLHNYFKYKTLFTIHSVVFIIIFLGGTTLRWGGLVPPDPPVISAYGFI